jgi:hypothetical protein
VIDYYNPLTNETVSIRGSIGVTRPNEPQSDTAALLLQEIADLKEIISEGLNLVARSDTLENLEKPAPLWFHEAYEKDLAKWVIKAKGVFNNGK